MFRTSLCRRRGFDVSSLSQAVSHAVKRRNPNEHRLDASENSTRLFFRAVQGVILAFIVAISTTYEQFMDPSLVKLPIQDGRTLVT